MSENYKIRISGSGLTRAFNDAKDRNPAIIERLGRLLTKLQSELADVLASDSVVRIPDQRVLDQEDPNLAFFALRDGGIEIGFFIDRKTRTITITSVEVGTTPEETNVGQRTRVFA